MASRASVRAKQGQHICFLYDSEPEMKAMVTPFITAGLMMNEKCAVVADASRLLAFQEELENSGVSTLEMITNGQLVMRPEVMECLLSASAVNMSDLDGKQSRIAADLISCGYDGYRCVFAVTDFLCHLDGNSLIEREIALNKLLSKVPATLLLLYDRRLMNDSTMADMFDIHPRLIDRNTIYENPAYVLPEELL